MTFLFVFSTLNVLNSMEAFQPTGVSSLSLQGRGWSYEDTTIRYFRTKSAEAAGLTITRISSIERDRFLSASTKTKKRSAPSSALTLFLLTCVHRRLHHAPLCHPRAAKQDLDGILTVLAAQTPRTCFTVLVLANKQDLRGALSPAAVERAVDISSR